MSDKQTNQRKKRTEREKEGQQLVCVRTRTVQFNWTKITRDNSMHCSTLFINSCAMAVNWNGLHSFVYVCNWHEHATLNLIHCNLRYYYFEWLCAFNFNDFFYLLSTRIVTEPSSIRKQNSVRSKWCRECLWLTQSNAENNIFSAWVGESAGTRKLVKWQTDKWSIFVQWKRNEMCVTSFAYDSTKNTVFLPRKM